MMHLCEPEIEALALTPRAWREAIASVFRRSARGAVQVGPKSHLRPSPQELLLALTAVDLERGYSACKCVNVVPAARAAGSSCGRSASPCCSISTRGCRRFASSAAMSRTPCR